MSVSGLTCNPSRFSLGMPISHVVNGQVDTFPAKNNKKVIFQIPGKPRKNMDLFGLNRNYSFVTSWKYMTQQTHKAKSAMDTSFGNMGDNSTGNLAKFSRMRVWDPYKRLGINTDASSEEIWGSRNFLLQQYAGHERSEESIEAAFEKIMTKSFNQRKKTKFNLKTRIKKKVEESPSWVKQLLGFVEVPPSIIILRRLFLFAFMGGWSIMNSADGGPAFQVAVSLAACIYFLNEKTKSLARAFILGFGALVVGWVCGSLLVPMVPTVVWQPSWTLELLTSLVSYVFLFLSCTFLK